MDVQLNAHLENAKSNLIETAGFVALYGDADDKNPAIFTEMLNSIFNIKSDFMKTEEALEEGRSCRSKAELDHIYTRILAKPNKRKSHNGRSTEFKAIATTLKRVLDPDGHNRSTNDVAIVDWSNDLLDPLTRRPIQNPVRNPKCGHIYELDTMKKALQINKHLRCPVVGCPNKDFISVDILSVDQALQIRIADTQAAAGGEAIHSIGDSDDSSNFSDIDDNTEQPVQVKLEKA